MTAFEPNGGGENARLREERRLASDTAMEHGKNLRDLKIELLDTLRYLREERRVRGVVIGDVTRRIVELERELGR